MMIDPLIRGRRYLKDQHLYFVFMLGTEAVQLHCLTHSAFASLAHNTKSLLMTWHIELLLNYNSY